MKDEYNVRRFWKNEQGENGTLRHVDRDWHFHYEAQATGDDEQQYKLNRHSIVENKCLNVNEQDELLRTFRVVRSR